MIFKTIFTSTVLGLTSTIASAASFDCSKAQTPVERTICSNENLGSLDVEMATIYKKVVSTERNNQIAWIKYRNACGSDDKCLIDRYKERIEALKKAAEIVMPSETNAVQNKIENKVNAPIESKTQIKPDEKQLETKKAEVAQQGMIVNQGADSNKYNEAATKENFLPPPLSNKSDNQTLTEAYGFMLFGDKGWKSVDGYLIDKCIVKYKKVYGQFDRLDHVHNLNLVNWNSATIQQLDSSSLFNTKCNGKCYSTILYNKQTEEKRKKTGKLDEESRELISFEFFVTRDRFQKALRDVIKACPGVQSKY